MGGCGINKSSGCRVDEGKTFWAQKSKTKSRRADGGGCWNAGRRDGEAVREEAEIRKGQMVETLLC